MYKTKLFTTQLISNLGDYNYAYILVRGTVTVVTACKTQAAFKNCALLPKCIIITDWSTIDDAEDIDFVMPVYILIECCSNYSSISGSLWNFDNYIANNDRFKSFKYKVKLLRATVAQPLPNQGHWILDTKLYVLQ